ncbi:hypothetical protein MTO96_011581 [Rhipicephalus appendiculatus]
MPLQAGKKGSLAFDRLWPALRSRPPRSINKNKDKSEEGLRTVGISGKGRSSDVAKESSREAASTSSSQSRTRDMFRPLSNICSDAVGALEAMGSHVTAARLGLASVQQTPRHEKGGRRPVWKRRG